MVGRKIGQFHIEEELGVGGMGTVYKARDTRLNRHVAIKALHPHVLRDSQAYRRFKNEAQVSAQLSNPNVATLYDFIKEKDQSYLIMEYIDGVTIEERLKEEGALSVEETIRLSKQILNGLSEAHRLNILHRDLKPANVMIKAGSYAKLMDFGIARLETATRLTANNKVIGTVEYMAPELLKGKEPSKASDLYAVGVLIYEMLTGKTLFVANSEAALVYSIVNEKPKLDLSGVPPELRKIIKKLTNKLPQSRYWNTENVLKDLTRVSVEKERSAISLPSFSIKWPSSFLTKSNSSFRRKIMGWIGPFKEGGKTRLVLLGSIVISLFIVLAGSVFSPATKGRSLPPAGDDVVEVLDSERNFVPDLPAYAGRVNSRNIEVESYPEPTGHSILPPVTIEKKLEVPVANESPVNKPKNKPKEQKTTTPVIISGGASSEDEIEAEKQMAESTEVVEHSTSPVEERTEKETMQEIASESETPEKQLTIMERGEAVSITIPEQYLPVVFGQSISSDRFQAGEVVYFRADSKVVVRGATIIAKGARVRASVKTNTVKKNGKTEFSIVIDAVESTAKKWLPLVYPEYSLIQKGEVLFPAGTRLSRVKIKPQRTTIYE